MTTASTESRHPGADVERWLPHRAPMLLLDDVVLFEPGVRCISSYHAAPENPVFRGHFPGQPVFPGVLTLENMAQTACYLIAASQCLPPGGLPALARVRECTFSRRVLPGDVLETEVHLLRQVGGLVVVTGETRVAGKRVATAELIVGLQAADAGGEQTGT